MQNRIKEIRESIGMKQHELSVKTGITQSMICRIENGSCDSKVSIYTRIANALNCKVDDLIKKED